MKQMKLFETERSGRLYQKVLELAGLFHSAGGRALLVGGAVRDGLLGRTVKDFDLEIHGLSAARVLELLQKNCEVDAVGMSFGVIKVKHLDLDISLPRRENKTGAGHRGFLVEVAPDLSIAEAAARRDFTVNAIMYDPLSCELLDPHGGIKDLQNKILRHVSFHFSEDPLRVLRGMQFAARMDFSFAPETIALCTEIDQNELAVERIGTEWEKLLLQGVCLSKGIGFLQQCGWDRFYPELTALSPEKREKTLALLDRCASLRTCDRQKDLVLMGTALVLYMDGRERFLRRLWNRNEMIEKIIAHAGALVRFIEGEEKAFSATQVRRLALELKGVELFCLLLQGSGFEKNADEMKMYARSLDVFLKGPEPLLTGKHGIEAGISPGPALGKIMKECFEAQLDGVFCDLEGGKAFLKQFLKEQKALE